MSNAKLLVDTNIVSYAMKNDSRAHAYVKHLEGRLLAISFVTVAELYCWAEKSNWGVQKRKQLETRLKNYVVVPYDNDVARCYARLVTERERKGNPIASNDAWIAACAVRHGIPLVTHNARHFESISSLDVITETTA